MRFTIFAVRSGAYRPVQSPFSVELMLSQAQRCMTPGAACNPVLPDLNVPCILLNAERLALILLLSILPSKAEYYTAVTEPRLTSIGAETFKS